MASTSCSHEVTLSQYSGILPILSLSFSRTRSTSISICALLRQRVQPISSTENDLPSLSDVPLLLRPSSGVESFFTVHSKLRSTHFDANCKTVSSLSANNTTELPYQLLDENPRPPKSHPYHYPQRIGNQITIHPRQGLRYHIRLGIRINNSLQYSTFTRDR